MVAELERRPVQPVVMDISDFPESLRLAATLSNSGWAGGLASRDRDGVDLERVGAVYYRRPTRFRLRAGMSEADSVFAMAEARYGLGGVLASLHARWVNEPGRIAMAEYKPLGLKIAAQCGLDVPATLITNDHAAAIKFAKQIDGPIVCKTLSSIAFREDDQTHITFTTPVSVADIDPDELAATAHLLQAQVPKRHDVRVVMVGDAAFAVAIHSSTSQAHVDWRLDYGALTYAAIDAPVEVVTGMRRYLDRFGLHFAAFDFGVTDDGWMLYEANPNGQWLWLAEATGLPIPAAFADLLAEGCRP